MKLSDMQGALPLEKPSTETIDDLLTFVMEQMEDEPQLGNEETFIFGNTFIHATRQGSGDIDLHYGEVTHYATMFTPQSDI